nr:murein biosynthesis integral membrane protein MurJ [Candidatus Baumannia cicadellinicola]
MLFKQFAAVSSITILSRVLGFARDVMIARLFGSGMATDAFFIAFKLPNMLRRIFAEGAFSQAFVPILAEYKMNQGEEVTRNLIAYITGLMLLTLTLVSIAGVLGAPWIIKVIAPGFSQIPEKFHLTSSLLRVTFPYIMLISLTSLLGAILNAWNIFYVPAFVPIFLNISMIIFAILAKKFFNPPIMALAWAVVTGGILQLGYQLAYINNMGLLVKPRLKLIDYGLWRVLQLMIPAMMGVSVSHISLIINTILSSFLLSGSVSWMYYADRLMEFPSGVLGVTLGTILLPSLSRSFCQGNKLEYSLMLDWGLRLCFLLALPSAVALAIIAKPLIVALFQYENFSSFDAMMTHHALLAYSVGLIGIMLVKVLSPGFYSRQDIKTPVKLAFITLIITQLMNIIFIGSLKHVGLSLSIGLGACLNAGLLYWQLRSKQIFKPQPGWMKFFLRLIFTVLVMAVALIVVLMFMPDWTQGSMLLRMLRIIGVILVGIIFYLIALNLAGFRLKDFIKK